MGKSKTVPALLLGLFVGAAAGMLLAPHKGSKTRKKIRKAGEDLLAGAKAKVTGDVNGATMTVKSVAAGS